ncbi:MAG TPA: C40 family peptidase [Segetibacter sp.]|nr:C40 family peptidase [Segetibacter sp.]
MRIAGLLCLFFIVSCKYYNGKLPVEDQVTDTLKVTQTTDTLDFSQTKAPLPPPLAERNTGLKINTGSTKPDELIAFAQSLMGVRYKYGSSDPVNGFDCSGFITYVFNHFNIAVPRSSIDFTDYDTKVDLNEAKRGDLILFTGTDSTIREVGHMGIITSVNNDLIEFIHSSSGKANGVTITPLNKYYLGRFVKVIRVF